MALREMGARQRHSMRTDPISVPPALAASGTDVDDCAGGGTERLRRVIGKTQCEDDLLAAVGWRRRSTSLLKMYFMLGHPTETDDDIQASWT